MAIARQALLLVVLLAVKTVHAGPFVVFPDCKELRSPDERFVIHSVEHTAKPGEFTGVFRTLTVEDTVNRTTRGLHNYLGRVAVAWSGNNYIIVTEYMGKRTSRALVFRLDRPLEYIAINKTSLMPHVSDELRMRLESNDHVYVEVSRIESGHLFLRIWGYGPHDPKGFGFGCAYDLDQDHISCRTSGDKGENRAPDSRKKP